MPGCSLSPIVDMIGTETASGSRHEGKAILIAIRDSLPPPEAGGKGPNAQARADLDDLINRWDSKVVTTSDSSKGPTLTDNALDSTYVADLKRVMIGQVQQVTLDAYSDWWEET